MKVAAKEKEWQSDEATVALARSQQERTAQGKWPNDWVER